MRIPACVTFFLLLSSFVYGQKQGYGLVRGTVTDSVTRQPLEAASVSIYEKADSSVAGYAITNKKGEFSIRDVPRGKEVVLLISFNGLKTIRKPLKLSVSEKELDAGEFRMVKSFTELEEVLVTAEKPPVVLRNDTLEFNAGSFKTPPNAVVEDLLKLLPGAEVDKDGNIIFNGKPVSKVMVDGKEFFGSDPKIATRNLPKDIVDKIQITDLKSREAIFNKTTDGNEDKVINITLKKDKKKGVFGRVAAGYGSSDRYEAGANLNHFNKSRQISFVGSANNTNRQNFSRGDFNISNARSSFSGGGGLTESISGGINFSEDLGKKLDLSGSYFYNNSETVNQVRSRRQNILPDTSFYYNSDNNSQNTNGNHRVNLNIEYRPDSMTNVSVNSSFGLSNGSSFTQNNAVSISPGGKPINSNQNSYNSDTKGNNISGHVFISRRFKKQGRGVSFSINLNTSDQRSLSRNIGNNIFFKPGGDMSADTINQLINSKSNNSNIGLSASYTEPISKTFSILLRANYSRSNNSSERYTNDFDPVTGKYEHVDTSLSNAFRNLNESYTPNLTLQFNKKRFRWSIGNGIRFLRQDNYSITGDSMTTQRYINFFPNANVGYNFSQTAHLNFNYSGSTQQPSIQQLQPVQDNRNPLYIRLGNPGLQPAFTHNVNGNLNLNNLSRQSSWMVSGNFSTTSNQIINEVRFDSIGRQISRPVNTDGNYYSSMNLSYSKGWKRKTWSLRLNISNNFGYSKTTSFINSVKNNARTYNIGPRIGLNYTWKEMISIMPSYAVRYNNGTYSVRQQGQSPEYTNTNLSLDIFFTWAKRLVIENNIQNNYNSRTAPGFRKNITIWNAAASYMLFKKKQGNIRLTIYDILKQNTNIYRSISQTAVEDVEMQVLRRYFMLSFSYNLRRF
jgi:hypothetical protein